jgi:hypothetical protein
MISISADVPISPQKTIGALVVLSFYSKKFYRYYIKRLSETIDRGKTCSDQNKWTNNDIQTTTQKAKDLATQTAQIQVVSSCAHFYCVSGNSQNNYQYFSDLDSICSL